MPDPSIAQTSDVPLAPAPAALRQAPSWAAPVTSDAPVRARSPKRLRRLRLAFEHDLVRVDGDAAEVSAARRGHRFQRRSALTQVILGVEADGDDDLAGGAIGEDSNALSG